MKKILLLVKSHDSRFVSYHNELYENLEILFKKHFSFFNNVELVFLKANPKLENDTEYNKEENIFWIKAEENYWETLKLKVIKSVRYFLDIHDKEPGKYDFVFITNLSTFINIEQLIKYIENNSFMCASYTGYHTETQSGENVERYHFPSGAGALYPVDVLKNMFLFYEKNQNRKYPDTDDIFMGNLLYNLKIPISKLKRIDIEYPIELKLIELHNENYLFCPTIRIKFKNNRHMELQYHKKLYDCVYGI